MKKIILAATLALSSTFAFADSCSDYISEVDGIMTSVREHITDPKELQSIDDSMTQMKNAIAAMPDEQREKACAQALEQVPVIKQMLEKAIEQKKAQ